MMKSLKKISLLIICSLFMIISVNAADENTSLKDLKDEVAKNEAKLNAVNSEKAEAQEKIKDIESELDEIAKTIDDCHEKIEAARLKIEELNAEIEVKQKEIDNLLSFLQISNGDNIYLEYIFKAKSFTDFIYRSSVVEQLTKYNDELIDNMNKLIEEEKELQEELKDKIEESEKANVKLQNTLKKYNLQLDDLIDDHKDAAADLKASKDEVALYEALYKEFSCSETTSIIDCLDMPYATSLTRPTKKGTITSNYGMRLHPTLGYYRLHAGIDIAVSMGTNVYASAAGRVTKIVKVSNPNKKNSSCGGNMVYIKHSIDGKEYTTVYMHLHTINVKLNEIVTLNSIVGTSGGGESYDRCTTGPHLHFGVQYRGSYVDPRNYINFPAKGKRYTSRW